MEPFLNHPFELLFDLSCFGEDNEIPVHWLAQFFQLVFSELNDYLVTLLLFNPNFHMQRYIRKLPRKLTNKLVKRTRFAITISDLDDYISPSEVKLPKQTCKCSKRRS
jgi:neurofibromin 1